MYNRSSCARTKSALCTQAKCREVCCKCQAAIVMSCQYKGTIASLWMSRLEQRGGFWFLQTEFVINVREFDFCCRLISIGPIDQKGEGRRSARRTTALTPSTKATTVYRQTYSVGSYWQSLQTQGQRQGSLYALTKYKRRNLSLCCPKHYCLT